MADSHAEQIKRHFAVDVPKALGVAVSGGSDSLALLHLLHDFCGEMAVPLSCATVDHGLRKEAAREAEYVAQVCADLGVPHATQVWSGWDGMGNTQDAARRARYDLLSSWAMAQGIQDVVLGHTQDDQAETVLMRLARGAGVDGLSAMSPRRMAHGVLWHRPLLQTTRAGLRAYLTGKGQTWVDDPSNEDGRYDRIKVRRALQELDGLGIEKETLAQVARHMAAARDALRQQTHDSALEIVAQKAGGLQISWSSYQSLPSEIARRLTVAAISWISGSEYAPRGRAVETALETVKKDNSATLEGCRMLLKGNDLWIFREFNAVKDLSCLIHENWDARWEVTGPLPDPDLRIAALGEAGLLQCPDWRDLGLPRALLLSTPAVWRNEEFMAAPLAIPDGEWQAHLRSGRSSYFDAVFAH